MLSIDLFSLRKLKYLQERKKKESESSHFQNKMKKHNVKVRCEFSFAYTRSCMYIVLV